ncbi:MAG: fibronectin type III domain-containing protein [Patescibacteria group bacterium]|nr:fibronectin type III domain-containing protein [Patescibacteria group bacterium]
MNKFTKILITSIFTIFMIGSFAQSAFAINVNPLSVIFNPNPLFSAINFAPGSEVTGNVTVTNNSGSSQNIIVESTNAVDTSGLGDKLNLTIKEGANTKYTNTLGSFLRSGEVSLSSLANNASTNYTFNVTFDNSAGDSLQNKTLGFDLCVGFQGGSLHCGDTVISGGSGGGSGGSISGSHGGSAITLVIYNEQATNIVDVNSSGTATITWNTNKLSTSQVIYGISPGPYNLDLSIFPNLGYPYGSVEDSNKVTNHSVLLTGLIPGQTYVYRVVSHASPATVSYEHKFTVPPLLLAQNTNIGNGNTINNAGQVLGAEINPLSTGSDNNVKTSSTSVGNKLNNNQNLLGASAGSIIGIPNSLLWILLLILLLLLFILIRRRKNKESKNTNITT